MKLYSAAFFSAVPSIAFATTTTAAPAAPTAPAVSTPASSVQPGTKVSMRVQIDPFYKNLNNASKNYKTPKLDSLRLMFERDLGQNSKADVEIRLHELENGKKYGLTSDGKRANVNTDVIKYYHLLFKLPGIEDLELGFVREMEPGLFGYTDKVRGSNVVESVSFTGHMNRIDGYRALLNTGWNDLKFTYHLARNASLDDSTLGTKPSDTTWYHKLTTDLKIDSTSLQFGLGTQGQWLEVDSNATLKSTLKYDTFFHLVAEQKIEQLRLKGGFAQDSYALVKNSDNSAGAATATTYLIGAKYDVEKELSLMSELNFRTLKGANGKIKGANAEIKDYSGLEVSEASKATKAESATEMAFTLAAQYKIDDKLSIIPAYNYFTSNRARSFVDNANGDAFIEKKNIALEGASGETSKFDHGLGLRVRYDY